MVDRFSRTCIDSAMVGSNLFDDKVIKQTKKNKFPNTNILKVTLIKRSTLLSGRVTFVAVLNLNFELFYCFLPVLNGQWEISTTSNIIDFTCI